jgi:hypothetical protein
MVIILLSWHFSCSIIAVMRQEDGQMAARTKEIWEKNLAVLQARATGLDHLPPLPANPPPLRRVKVLEGKYASLQVQSKEGRRVTLHSPRRA